MAVVERNADKRFYKIMLCTLKVIPMCMAFCEFLNTFLNLIWHIETPLLSYIGGCSFITWLFIYLAAIVFRFCIYHRMFLYYVLINNLISIYEFQWGIPVDDAGLLCIYSLVATISLFLILYFRNKCHY